MLWMLTFSIIHTNNKRGTTMEREKEIKGGNKRKVSKKNVEFLYL